MHESAWRREHQPEPASGGELQHARRLVLRYGWNAMAYQILNPGICLWFSADRQSVIGYVPAAGYRVVAGAPICAPEQLAAVSAAFEAEARQLGQRVCYFGAEERLAEVLSRRGPLARLQLGAQPVWRPDDWSSILARKPSLRAQLARARNKQVQAQRWSAAQATDHPELNRCLAEWLAARRLPALHFLVEPHTLQRLYDRRVYVALRNGQVVGFLLASPVPLRQGWLIEQIIRGRQAPNGTAELLLDAAMSDLTAGGARYVTLGLSPLSQRVVGAAPMPPIWLSLLLTWLRAHGRRFYNFGGLDAFKAKFMPQHWEPVYAMTSSRHISLGVLYAIAAAFSGTSPLLFIGHTLWRALLQEAQSLRRRLRR